MRSRIALAALAAILGHAGMATPALSSTAESRRAIVAAAQRYGFSPAGMLRVAGCESSGDRPYGVRLNEWATNGQYLGLFQLGAWARSRYLRGHWANPWANADAAARLARATGGFKGGQWSCGWAY